MKMQEMWSYDRFPHRPARASDFAGKLRYSHCRPILEARQMDFLSQKCLKPATRVTRAGFGLVED